MGKDYGKIIYRKETGAYVIGKLCVPHPDDDTVPDEVRRQFAELWADVDAYAEAHPEMVTEEQPYVPPVPTLDEVKAAKLSETNAAADRALATLTATYPDRELATFDKQESEARAYAADATASTPLLSALAQARGIPLDELVRRVLAKADAFAVASGSIIGQRQALEDRLDVCTTVEEVQSIAVNIVMPGEEVSA